MKLTYFPLPGRAEASRLMLTTSGTAFEDNRVFGPAWMELKPKTPFGQLPVFEHDGKVLAESAAIDRYVAKLTGYYPEDAWASAVADQLYCLLTNDVSTLFAPTFAIADPEEKKKARLAICEGPLKPRMAQLTTLLENKMGEYIAGDKLSFADFAFFCQMSTLVSGFFDGVPKNLLDDYPVIKDYRNKIANVPGIKAYYENETEPPRVAFKPDA